MTAESIRCCAPIVHPGVRDSARPKGQKGEASVLDDLGMMYLQADEYEKSVPWYEQALLIQRELNNRPMKETFERLGLPIAS
jgi:hypothetical protein